MSALKLSAEICLQALAWYVLFTLPAILVFPIYCMSAAIALVSGVLACLFFWGILLLFTTLRLNKKNGYYSLFFLSPVLIVLSLELFIRIDALTIRYLFGPADRLIDMSWLLLFPALAVVAAWISIYRHREELLTQFNGY